MPLTDAERAKRYRERRRDGLRPVAYRRPADRRSRPQRWADAVATLGNLLDEYEAWREAMPEALREGATGERIDELLELRELVEVLEGAELPRGFGRD
jgi:hypothetical protein